MPSGNGTFEGGKGAGLSASRWSGGASSRFFEPRLRSGDGLFHGLMSKHKSLFGVI